MNISINKQEQYVLIKSDKNGDGIYTLGDDFSQGKWQQITLNYLKTEVKTDDGKASGLYFKANISSQWLFDSVTSSYLEINDNNVDVNKFAKDNIIINNNELKFQSTNSVLKSYNTVPATSTAGLDINEKISEITINSTFEKGYNGQATEQQSVITYLDENTAQLKDTTKWITQNSDNYDTVNVGASKFINTLLNRAPSAIPVLDYYGSEQQFAILSGEKRFRIYFSGTANYSADIYNSNNQLQETISTNNVTKWYYGNIKLIRSSGYLGRYFSISKIEYEPVTSNSTQVDIKPLGKVSITNHNVVAAERVKLKMKAKFANVLATDNSYIKIKAPNGTTDGHVIQVLITGANTNEVELIVPPLIGNANIEITNLDSTKSATIEYFNIYSVTESDWNYPIRNLDYPIISKTFYNNLTPSNYDNYEVGDIKKYYGETNDAYKYVKHLTSNGIKTKTDATTPYTINISYEANKDRIATLKFINLNNTSINNYVNLTCGSITKNIFINYGESDINISMPKGWDNYKKGGLRPTCHLRAVWLKVAMPR